MKPYLAIDIGNTRIKCGLFEGLQLKKKCIIKDINELMAILPTLTFSRIIISNVAYPLEEVREKLTKWNSDILYFDANTPIPILNQYQTPRTLGKDRLAAAVGAQGLFPDSNIVILDLGTAIKYDLVLKDEGFIGGLISPGKSLRFKALHTFTGKLPLVNAEYIPDLTGTNTEIAIISGVMNGILYEINGILEEYRRKYQTQIIITGGDAYYFDNKIKYPKFAAPDLVLEGLNRILICNA